MLYALMMHMNTELHKHPPDRLLMDLRVIGVTSKASGPDSPDLATSPSTHNTSVHLMGFRHHCNDSLILKYLKLIIIYLVI